MRGGAPMAIILVAFLSACAPSKMSVNMGPQAPRQSISRLAIAPGSGVFGEALAVELFNSGMTIVDSNQASTILGRVGLKEFELTTTQGYAALCDAGIEAILAVKSVDAADDTPESASVRITSTVSGETIAGITWQNGYAGQRGSIVDRAIRKNLSDSAREVAAEVMTRIRPESYPQTGFQPRKNTSQGHAKF
jgi:hypothetical protein